MRKIEIVMDECEREVVEVDVVDGDDVVSWVSKSMRQLDRGEGVGRGISGGGVADGVDEFGDGDCLAEVGDEAGRGDELVDGGAAACAWLGGQCDWVWGVARF
ncbi:hypothetical protein KS4_12480 [Poriferisphaera corsica]|uniref:Uncharacterized protein n=1 Tax=Poriferisphaera corsica TaxID=2528020 RepID=A0A517YSI4_9BACT|nr:hypothetical protein [Poriferisphaera corsica]QDU33203.1 hypothetical protein KS4_12480 [Poriferisphaera corsica]